MIDRRILLASVASLFGLAAFRWLRGTPAQAAEKFEVEKTDAEWRAQLTPQQYEILRQEGTERPNSSPLLKEHRKGIFACAGCDLPLFSSETKFESGTGWPSFYQPLENAVGKHEDRTFGMLRTEIHCRRCGGHLGHVFDDGPKPTGLRYCMDGFAMLFHRRRAVGDLIDLRTRSSPAAGLARKRYTPGNCCPPGNCAPVLGPGHCYSSR